MSGLKIMMFDEGVDQKMGIRCRFISDYYKIDSHVSTKERLLLEIKRNNPDVIFLDPNLYAKIDGIEFTQTIRSQFDIPVWYV